MKNTNSVMLDTTYVLPLFGIKVNLFEDFKEEFRQLWKNGLKRYDVYLPSICFIETMFKLLNEYRKKEDMSILERYQVILPTVLNSPIKIFNPEIDMKSSSAASIIRSSGHLDYMDCWIAGSAVSINSILLTEDKELINILKIIPETKKLIIWSWNDLVINIFKKKK